LPVVYHAHSEEQAKIGVIEIGFCAHSSMTGVCLTTG
jgi:hypothetical protein